MIEFSAPGSVFLLGEHDVVHERPAIVSAIGMSAKVGMQRGYDRQIEIYFHDHDTTIFAGHLPDFSRSYRKPSDYTDKLDPIIHLVSLYADELKDSCGLHISISSYMPPNSSVMGSSAAVLCAALGTLSNYLLKEVDPDDFFDVIYPIYDLIHQGNASGAEIASSSVGGHNLVRIDKSGKKPKLERQSLKAPGYGIIIGDTNHGTDTAVAAQQVMIPREFDSCSYERMINEIGDIVEEGEKALLSGDIRELGRLMNKNHEIVSRRANVSNPELERLIKSARSAGAYGARVSRDGKGIIMIALVDNDVQHDVIRAIDDAGGESCITSIGFADGVKREY